MKSVEVEEKWKAWAEKEVQVNAGNMVATERKKWQAKGKALPGETVSIASQANHAKEEVKGSGD